MILATMGLSTLLLVVGQPTFAAPRLETTEGTITFKVDEDPEKETTEPDEKGKPPVEIIIDEGDGKENTRGILRIQFVPNFKFGEHVGITAAEAKQNVQLIGHTNKETNAHKKVAPFVQVGDYRGEGQWRLTVKADKFKAAGQPDLENVSIKLPESTLTMDYHTTAQAETFVNNQGEAASIDTGGTTPVTILETKAGQTTSGYAVSNVFQSGYVKDEALTGTQGTTGVQFVKAAGQAPKADVQYTSVLTWTLADTL